MGTFIDLTGQKFGRLTVLDKAESNNGAQWRCSCACGNEKIVSGCHLRRGDIKSCGCWQAEHCARVGRNRFKHGASLNHRSRAYVSWQAMKSRCLNPNVAGFQAYYGGRGITVCDRWRGPRGFENFLADLGDRPEGTTLGRFGDEGNYEPRNCKWMTGTEQLAEQKIKRQQSSIAA